MRADLDTATVKRILTLSDNAQWSVESARHRCRDSFSMHNLTDILYRPFDNRRIYYHPSIIFNPRPGTMANLRCPGNLALLTNRRIRTGTHAHFLVTDHLVMAEALSSADNCNVYPLYVRHDQNPGTLAFAHGRVCALDESFMERMADGLTVVALAAGTGDLIHTIGPDDVFRYLYAIFYSGSYRKLFGHRLGEDFPRVPLTSNLDLFRSLCMLGEELVGLHLMEKHAPLITTFEGKGDNAVEKVRYTEPGQGSPKGRVWINTKQYFEDVPPDVWEFHIGGYQVCEKWLKDRGPKKGWPGRKLSDDDILHYQRVVAALKETIRIMVEIDEVIEAHGGWPLPGSLPEAGANGP